MPQVTFNGTKINVEFTESSSRQQLNSGENISTLFGKIKKIFSDLKAVCFSGNYNDLSNKPSSLPANGGNADTVGRKVPEKIFYDNGFSIDLNGATQSGCYATSPDTLNVPFSTWWLVDTTNYNNQFIVQKAHTIGNTAHTVSYIRNYANNAWSDWKEISTTPIKSTAFSATADGTRNFNLWVPSENKVPISIQLDNKTFYAVPFLYNNQVWLGSTINEVTRQPVTNTTVSGTVYYIEI